MSPRPITFDTPESLFEWHLEHWETDEDDDYAAIGNARCPWCRCKIYKAYHESDCPVRTLIAVHRSKHQSANARANSVPVRTLFPLWPKNPSLLDGWMWEPDADDGRWVAFRRIEQTDGDDVLVRVHEGSWPPDGTLRITVQTSNTLPWDPPSDVALGMYAAEAEQPASAPAEVYAAVARANELLDAYKAGVAADDLIEFARVVRDLCAEAGDRYGSGSWAPIGCVTDEVRKLEPAALLVRARERLADEGHEKGSTRNPSDQESGT